MSSCFAFVYVDALPVLGHESLLAEALLVPAALAVAAVRVRAAARVAEAVHTDLALKFVKNVNLYFPI